MKDLFNSEDLPQHKAWCVCNGKPSNCKTAIFGYTFVKIQDHVSGRLLWASGTIKDLIVCESDAFNNIFETSSFKILYMYLQINNTKSGGRHEIVPNWNKIVLSAYKSLQGHPESSQSLGLLINKILTETEIETD